MGSGDLEAELAAGLGSGGSLSMIYCFLCSTVKLEVGSSIPIGFSNLAIFNCRVYGLIWHSPTPCQHTVNSDAHEEGEGYG